MRFQICSKGGTAEAKGKAEAKAQATVNMKGA